MPPRVTLVGLPWDASSSFQTGAAGAPARIRQALHSPSSNSWNERGQNALAPEVFDDAGDVSLGEEATVARSAIESAISTLIADQRVPIALGGDHSITYPIVRGFRVHHDRLTIVHIDAHGDLYDEFDGDRFSHACPFARVMEEGLAARLIQIGVRTLTSHLRDQIARFGVETFGMDRWWQAPLESIHGPLYVSIDLDALDPAFAPGVSHPEPGGLSVRDVVAIIARLPVAPVGADVVEYNPENDLRDLTARVAAKLVKELIGGMSLTNEGMRE
ncbi:MAG: agmatinase [Vicinamibacterales bacterium]